MTVLSFEGVVKHYADADDVVRAVDGVSLEVEAGQVVALYGPSGSGKTTLLLLAAALLAPDRGTVRFQGADIASMSRQRVAEYQRRELGFIYQSFHLMSGVPAVENAAIKLLADGVPLRRARGAASELLERVGLGARLEHPPERLSGGERQRVAIARALAGSPKLILADEPTGSLDSHRGAEILRLLAGIAKGGGAGLLLVTHDPQAAAVADRVFALRDGALTDESHVAAAVPPQAVSSAAPRAVSSAPPQAASSAPPQAGAGVIAPGG